MEKGKGAAQKLSWKQTIYFFTWLWRETEAGPPGTPSHSARPLCSGRCTSASCSWVTVSTLYSVQSSSREPWSVSLLTAATNLVRQSVYSRANKKKTFFYQYVKPVRPSFALLYSTPLHCRLGNANVSEGARIVRRSYRSSPNGGPQPWIPVPDYGKVRIQIRIQTIFNTVFHKKIVHNLAFFKLRAAFLPKKLLSHFILF